LIAKELISLSLPLLKCTDKGEKALNIMEAFRVSHLPLVRDNELIGVISDKDIYDRELEMCSFNDKTISLVHAYVYQNQHIYELAQKMYDLKLTLLPVLNSDESYLGSVTISDLAENIVKVFSAFEPGAVIVLEMSPANFSLSQIAQITESNNAKILSMYTHYPENSNEFDVSIKLNATEISSIIQTFVRYNYNIKAVYMDDSLLHDMYSERYDMFMKYMNL
jgi:predicted transcriptional regulator